MNSTAFDPASTHKLETWPKPTQNFSQNWSRVTFSHWFDREVFVLVRTNRAKNSFPYYNCLRHSEEKHIGKLLVMNIGYKLGLILCRGQDE